LQPIRKGVSLLEFGKTKGSGVSPWGKGRSEKFSLGDYK